ncbi:MAG: DUF6261 family protein [Paludibacter sp.]
MNIKTKANRVGNTSLAALSVRIIDTVQKSGIEEAAQSKQFLHLQEVNSRYQAAILPTDTAQKTEVKAMYRNRTQYFTEIYDYVEGQTKSPLADVRASANRVFEVLNKYGRNVSRSRIADLSVRYIRIIEALKRPEMEADVTKLSLTAKLTEFDNAQLRYEDLYMQLGNDSQTHRAPTTLRKEMLEAVKLYVEELKWAVNANDTDAWRTLYSNVEQRFNELTVSQSRKKTAKAENPAAAEPKTTGQPV